MRTVIKHVLAFFATADVEVNNNIAQNFMMEIDYPEVKAFFAVQQMIEVVHQETYAMMLDSLVCDEEEHRVLRHSQATMPCVQKKAAWAKRFMDRETASFPERLIAFGLFEGVMFSASFATFFFLKTKGIMPGLTLSNTFIARDEGMHCKFSQLLYSKLVNRLPEDVVHSLFREAVDIEEAFVREAMQVPMIGLNADLMCQQVRHVADHLLVGFGYPKLWNVESPFSFMALGEVTPKTNFFENKLSEYGTLKRSRSDGASEALCVDADF